MTGRGPACPWARHPDPLSRILITLLRTSSFFGGLRNLRGDDVRLLRHLRDADAFFEQSDAAEIDVLRDYQSGREMAKCSFVRTGDCVCPQSDHPWARCIDVAALRGMLRTRSSRVLFCWSVNEDVVDQVARTAVSSEVGDS